MSILAIRKGRLGRGVTMSVLIVILMFGGSLIPPPELRISPMEPIVKTTVLNGVRAASFLAANEKKDERLRSARRRARMRLSAEQKLQLNEVVIIGHRREPRTGGLIAWMGHLFRANADPIQVQDGDIVAVYTPYEDDSNYDTAEFHGYTVDVGSEQEVWYDARVNTFDPENDFEITNLGFSCSNKKRPAESAIASIFSGSVHAQYEWHGIDCEDGYEINNYLLHTAVPEAIRNGVIAGMAGALVCIATGPFWLPCLTIGGISTMMTTVAAHLVDMEWSCRCIYWGIDCAEEEPPPI